MKKGLALLVILALAFSLIGCEELEVAGGPADVKMGMAYYNAHDGAMASAVAVVDADGKILDAYLDDIFFRNINDGYVGLPGVETARIAPKFKDAHDTVVSKKNLINSDLYGAAMVRGGSTVLPADNLAKIEEFAIGKTVAELEAMGLDNDANSASIKDEIQAATGATFVDNMGYLNTILLAAKNAQASEEDYTVSNANNVVLKQAYYNPHGAPAIATVLVEGNKIVASLLDELYFFAVGGEDGLFDIDEAKSIPKFAEGQMLSSKKTSGIYGASINFLDQLKAIETFINGKTIAELQAAYDQLGTSAVADVVATVTLRDTKYYIKAAMIAADPSLAEGDPRTVTEDIITHIGIGYIPVDKSKSATADTTASAAIDSYIAAVAFNQAGKVVKASIDVLQASVGFDKDLQLTTDVTVKPSTKVEIGDGYAMINASQIGKNWYEQIAALEDWMVGKTVEEIKAMETYEKDPTHLAVPTEADLTSSVTITVEKYLDVIEKAYENKVEVPVGGLTLGLAIDTSVEKSVGLGASNPLAAIESTIAATLFGYDGKIIHTIIDITQQKVAFDAEGQVTDVQTSTKLELGEAYGMKSNSGIGLEWDQQIAGFGAYVVGKDINQVKGIELAENRAVAADLAATITVRINGYIDILAKSFANAK